MSIIKLLSFIKNFVFGKPEECSVKLVRRNGSIAIFNRIRCNSEMDDKGCLIWQGATSGDEIEGKDRGGRGYGRININGKHCQVHRIVYSLCVGRIPAKAKVLRKCGKKLCCHPEHLELKLHKSHNWDCC